MPLVLLDPHSISCLVITNIYNMLGTPGHKQLLVPSCKSASAAGEDGSLLVMFQMAAPMQGEVGSKLTSVNMGQLTEVTRV